jgi:hypothetical protein
MSENVYKLEREGSVLLRALWRQRKVGEPKKRGREIGYDIATLEQIITVRSDNKRHMRCLSCHPVESGEIIEHAESSSNVVGRREGLAKAPLPPSRLQRGVLGPDVVRDGDVVWPG